MLLGAGAAVAARDHSNRCPLHYAGGSVAVTQLLLDFGADPEAQVTKAFTQQWGTMYVNSRPVFSRYVFFFSVQCSLSFM